MKLADDTQSLSKTLCTSRKLKRLQSLKYDDAAPTKKALYMY